MEQNYIEKILEIMKSQQGHCLDLVNQHNV